ncbi:MAG: diacylglycerol kinase family protein [Ruminococcus sp.]|nr:diacylglycerol kinase family protein [Ruminococcus sp.]
MKQLRSFFYAFRGVWEAVCTEAHMRFHLTAAFYVLLLSPFFRLSATQYAVLVLLIAAVLAAELFNTAVETVCDLVTRERHPLIRRAKDIAAAAVLLLSAAAVAVAVLFFWNADAFARMWAFFVARPLWTALLVLSAVAAVFFVMWGPRGFSRKIFKNHRKPKG